MQLLAVIEQLDDIARTLVTLREELNLIGQQQWFDEFRDSFADLIHTLSKLNREMAEAVAVRGGMSIRPLFRTLFGNSTAPLQLGRKNKLYSSGRNWREQRNT